MKKIKNKFCVCLFTACLVLLSGCSGNEYGLDKKNPVSIVVWHYYNGPQQTAFEKLVTQFNETVGAEKGIIVEAFSQGSINQLEEKILDSANKKVGAEEMPDIFGAYSDSAYEIDKLGLVADISPYFTQEEKDEYIDSYLSEGSIGQEGAIKIFPVAKSTEVFMLNKTDWEPFANATGATIDSLSSWEGIAQMAEQYYEWTDSLTQTPDDGEALFGRDAMANYILIGAKQLGCEIFEVEDGALNLNLDREVMKKLWDNYYVPYIHGYYKAVGRFRSDDVKTRDILACVCSTSGALYFPESIPVESENRTYPIELAVLPAPVFQNGERVAVQQGAGLVVTKSDETRQYAATVFLKYFTQAENNVDFSISSGYLPVKESANNIEFIHSVAQNNEDMQNNAILEQMLPIAIKQVTEEALYTPNAFNAGKEARSYLEYALSDKAQQDAQTILELVNQGISKKEAVSRFDTEENFNNWLNQIETDLKEIVA